MDRLSQHAACLARPMLRPPAMTEALGWLSSFVLVLTIGHQVYKQWRSGHSEGVSRWLFVGQMGASAGFTIYSWLVGNWVFVVTNALMLMSAVIGYLIVLRHHRVARRAAVRTSGTPASSGALG
jgi:uncharacterized protein with PQ loop repeat